MIRARLCWPLALASLSGVGACDGGEVVVFPVAQAGSAGTHAGAGSAGLVSVAGAGGSFAGAPTAAGSSGATSGAGGAGGSGGGTIDKACRSTMECDPSWLCQKQDCSDAEGVCLPRPVEDDPHQAPVCGCDHNTYWNDTLRQRFGISAILNLGSCKSGANTCMSSDDCCVGSDDCASASCSQQLPGPSACSMPGTGQCWMIPKDCTSTDDKPAGLPCPSLVPPGTPPPCLTLCEALQARRPYVRVPQNYTCP